MMVSRKCVMLTQETVYDCFFVGNLIRREAAALDSHKPLEYVVMTRA